MPHAFVGDGNGRFRALDDKTGESLPTAQKSNRALNSA